MRSRERSGYLGIVVATGILCGICLVVQSKTGKRFELEGETPSEPLTQPPKVLDCGPDGTSCNLDGRGDHYVRKQRGASRTGAASREGRWMVNSLFGTRYLPHMQQSALPTLWGFDNNKYGVHKSPAKDASDYENYQRSAGAEHHSIADIGTWWGDNNAWYDGWEAHRADVNQPPRWWDKDFDGYKSYVRDLERDMPDSKWRNDQIKMGDGDQGEAFGDGVAMNDDETYERERMARTFDDPAKFGPNFRDRTKIYYDMTTTPGDPYPGYTVQTTKHKGSKGTRAPPWCDWILGCPAPYTNDGDLQWNTEPDDPHDKESYVTNWYRVNQAR